jgi:hypothetical protein
MAWTLTVVLAVIAVVLAAVYRIAVKETRYLTALLIHVLLDEETYRKFQGGLHKMVMELQAKNASDLYTQVSSSLSRPAPQLHGDLFLESRGLLWKVKQRGSHTND